MTEDTVLLRRFMRTVRVASHTALAEYEIGQGRRAGAAPVRFEALAARSAGAWRFPDAGLAADDGLVCATLVRGAAGAPVRLVLQAQGSAGLDTYADRGARISFGPVGPDAAIRFDADGRAAVELDGLDLDESELASFSIELEAR